MLAAPRAHADEQTVKLIQLLIQKGILTSGQAGELLRETGAPAKGRHAARASAPASTAAATQEEPPARQGEIRVTYVPQFVRKQIADEVRAQVMTESREEGWAAPDALPEWTRRVRVFGDIRARYESDSFDKGNYNNLVNYAGINGGQSVRRRSARQRDRRVSTVLDTTQIATASACVHASAWRRSSLITCRRSYA